MAEGEAIWYLFVDGAQRGPLTKAQVFEFLRGGILVGSDLIWCPGFPEWKSVSEINEFWQPPPLTAVAQKVSTQERVQGHSKPIEQPDDASVDEKLSLWNSANAGLSISTVLLLLQVAVGRGYELASYAHTGSAATIAGLIGRILALPLLFVMVALVRNLFNRGKPRSSASVVKGALTFTALFVTILAALFVYGEIFFSSTDPISGEARKKFIAEAQLACVQRQRSINQAVTEAQVHSYCACFSQKFADDITYKQLGTELDTKALADLRQKVEAADYKCR